MSSTKRAKYRAPALDKGLDILELMARTGEPLTMTAIGDGIGYSKGEIFRMLQVLEERGYIARAADSGYVLTNRLFRLGMERPPIKPLVEAALPAMHVVASEVAQPCHLAVTSGDQMVVIARVDPQEEIGFVVRIGYRLPLSRSTSGTVLFAFQTTEVRARMLAVMEAAGTLFRRRQFIARADKIREQGWASVPSSDVDGVTDLSAPVLQAGSAIGALTVPYVERHPAKVSVRTAIEHLCAAAARVSSELAT